MKELLKKYRNLIFKNTLGVRVNMLYRAYRLYCRLKAGEPSDAHRPLRADFERNGIVKLGLLDVKPARAHILNQFAGVEARNGFCQYPRRYNRDAAALVYDLVRQIYEPVKAVTGHHFKVNWFEIQRIVPGDPAAGGSFAYHTDDTPPGIAKIFIYLTDTAKQNGAFRAFDRSVTDSLIGKGILRSVSPGSNREEAQKLVSRELEQQLSVVEGPAGLAFMFDNNLVHKGTLPETGERVHISMEIMPSPRPLTFERFTENCDADITEYFPKNPFNAEVGSHAN